MQQDPEALLFLLEPVALLDLGVFPFGVFRQLVLEAWALGLLETFLASWAFPSVLDLECWTGLSLLVPDLS